jgi:hypothetical protein
MRSNEIKCKLTPMNPARCYPLAGSIQRSAASSISKSYSNVRSLKKAYSCLLLCQIAGLPEIEGPPPANHSVAAAVTFTLKEVAI